MVIESIIETNLINLADQFEPDELSFLALTSKIENPIRDKLAFALYKNLTDMTIAREWSGTAGPPNYRMDIAILKKKKTLLEPEAVIQLKAIYTFDAVLEEKEKVLKDVLASLKKDGKKAEALLKPFENANPKIYLLLLATDPKGEVPQIYSSVVKYSKLISKALREAGDPEKLRHLATETIETGLLKAGIIKTEDIIKSGVISGSKAFDLDTDILFWLMEYHP